MQATATKPSEYAPKAKAKPKEVASREQAQKQTEAFTLKSTAPAAPLTENGWGSSEKRNDPYANDKNGVNAAAQLRTIIDTMAPVNAQQRADRNYDLGQAQNNALVNSIKLRQIDSQNAVLLSGTPAAAETRAKIEYNNSTAGYNDRQAAQYAIAKNANTQFAIADTQAQSQLASAQAQAGAQKYVADQAAAANITGALYGAVGNIASGFGGGRYW